MRWEYRLRMIDPELGTGAEARAELCMRSARDGDEVPLLGMFDEAVVWLVARGQEAQWGPDPWSGDEKGCHAVRSMIEGGGLRLLECAGRVVGALQIGPTPEYAKPVDVPEAVCPSGSHFSRLRWQGARDVADRGGGGIGAAPAAGLLRVDCWAGAPKLIAWYERHGFVRSDMFVVDGWQGQVLEPAM